MKQKHISQEPLGSIGLVGFQSITSRVLYFVWSSSIPHMSMFDQFGLVWFLSITSRVLFFV